MGCPCDLITKRAHPFVPRALVQPKKKDLPKSGNVDDVDRAEPLWAAAAAAAAAAASKPFCDFSKLGADRLH